MNENKTLTDFYFDSLLYSTDSKVVYGLYMYLSIYIKSER